MPRTLHIVLPDEIYEVLRVKAEENGVTVTSYVKNILAEHLGIQFTSEKKNSDIRTLRVDAKGATCLEIIAELVDTLHRLANVLYTISRRLDANSEG